MKKSDIELVYDYLIDNPTSTNREIEINLELSEGVAKTYISRLVDRGFIEKTINENGKRKIKIIQEFEDRRVYKKKLSTKFQYYQEMIDIYMEDFREADTFNDRLRVGREIRLLVEKI